MRVLAIKDNIADEPVDLAFSGLAIAGRVHGSARASGPDIHRQHTENRARDNKEEQLHNKHRGQLDVQGEGKENQDEQVEVRTDDAGDQEFEVAQDHSFLEEGGGAHSGTDL